MALPRMSEHALKSDWIRGEVAVIGLARSGRSAATLLARAGVTVYASDASRSPALESCAGQLEREGVAVDLGTHDLARIERATLIVTSPGVPPDAPALLAAARRGITVVSEVEIGLRFLPELDYIAITGTNGKTTTTALSGHLLKALGLRAQSAGNIGTPLTELALSSAPPRWVALELSSFQLHDTPSVDPDVGVVTNLSSNHLDRYASVEAYYADKALLLQNARAGSTWVSNADDADVQRLVSHAPGLHARFSLERECDAWFDRARGELMVLGQPITRREDLQLLGDHNVANALAATLAVMLSDPEHRTPDATRLIGRGLRSFRGLEHRIEIVGEVDGVLWINDSKSTNVTSTVVALRGMTRPTVLLLGGRHKGEPYTSLLHEITRTVREVIAYGEAAPLIERDLKGKVPVHRLGSSFDDVMAKARRVAHSGDAVLLSPACSSYDMFDNYEQRGEVFKRLAVPAARE
jgi:UDP-N-acetylmuramoylalanine--D-glutamate ligase